jgi:hypothetical protein
MAAYCVKCGTALPENARFCGVCGTSLDDPSFDPYRTVAPSEQKTNGFAIAALILGIFGISILAIIFGVIANGRIARSLGREKGKGLATAGIVLGCVWFVGALLLAIAIPTFLGAHLRAGDREAQSSLRNTITAAKAIWTDYHDYRLATPPILQQNEGGLTFVDANTDSTGPTTVSSGSSGPTTFFAAVKSRSGVCWYLRDITTGANAGTMWNHARYLSSCRASVEPVSTWTAEPGSTI